MIKITLTLFVLLFGVQGLNKDSRIRQLALTKAKLSSKANMKALLRNK
jgi:hypothetical protein